MEVSALKHNALPGLRGPTPLLRLQSDERLIALIRRGHHAAFEALVSRYEARLLSFCRHMLSSREDAEDVLQEVFAAAFNAILADERAINVRPWLYRIARNRSLNHLRRAVAIGVDSMDVHYADHGQSTGDKVFKREAFRQLIEDVQQLPETQRTALLLREIDALSYEQISEAMETTVPSVKSLLVRARISLAEAAEARQLSCEQVRLELGEVAEGLTNTSAPVRRHLRHCDRCRAFRTQLKSNNQVMAALFPVGLLFLAKRLVLAKLGSTAGAGGAHATAAAGAGATAAAGASTGGAGAGLITAGAGALATKAAAGLAAAALVTAGAVEVNQVSVHHHPHPQVATGPVNLGTSHLSHAPLVRATAVLPLAEHTGEAALSAAALRRAAQAAKSHKVHPAAPTVTPVPTTTPVLVANSKPVTPKPVADPKAKPPATQTTTDTTVLPSSPPPNAGSGSGAGNGQTNGNPPSSASQPSSSSSPPDSSSPQPAPGPTTAATPTGAAPSGTTGGAGPIVIAPSAGP